MLLSTTLVAQIQRSLANISNPRRRRSRGYRTERLESRELLSAIAPLGGEVRVNTTTLYSQSLSTVAMDADGDYVVTWRSNGQDGSGYGIYAQRYNAVGVRQGGEFRVNTTTAGTQLNPKVAMDNDGDFIITWVSFVPGATRSDIYAQRYNSVGVTQGPEFRVNISTPYSLSQPAAAMDADGDFVVTWMSSGQDGSGWGVYGRRFNSAGVAQGIEFRVNTTTANSQENPTVAMDASGDFVVTWMSAGQDGSSWGVYGQRYNSAGVVQGAEFKVNTFTTDSQRDPAIAMDADGDFVVTWTSQGQESHYGVYAQRYNAAGLAQGGEFRVNVYTNSIQRYSTVAMDQDGDFAVTWSSYGQDGSGYGIYARRYNAAGDAQGTEFRVNRYTTSQQQFSALAMDAKGGFVVTWTSNGQDGSGMGIYAQLYQSENSVRLQGSTLQILGTDAADTIMVNHTGPDLQVTLNGVLSGYESALVTDIIVFGADGNDGLNLGSGVSQPALLNGGNGNDTLTGGGGNDQLVGGAGNDIYRFNTNAALGTDSIIDRAGIDLLSFIGSSAGVTVDLGSTASQIVNSNLTLTPNSVTSMENLCGGSGDDTLTGNALANELWGGEGHDSIVGRDGVDWLYGEAGNDILNGGDGNDTYVFNTNAALGVDSVIDSDGTDRLYFVGSIDDVTVDIGSTSAQIVNASLTLILASATSLENIDGGLGDDTLIGNSLANSLVGGGGNDSLWGGDGADWLDGQAGNDSLDGGEGDDTYPFFADTPLGSDSITDNSGIDRLTFYRSTTNVNVSLALTTLQAVNANLTLILASATSVENITGGSGDDTLTGSTLNNMLWGGGGNDSLVGGVGDDTLYGEAGSDSLDGGTGNDTYVFNTNTALGGDSLTDNEGIDQLYFVGSSNDITVSLGSTFVQTVNANLTLILNSATSIENLYGGSGDDVLTGNSLNNLLVGGPGNDLLTGDSGNDFYGFDIDSILGSDTIDESAGGIDTVDFRGTTQRGASIDLSNVAAQVVSAGYLTLTLSAATTLENVMGGDQDDLLNGNSLENRLTGGRGNDILKGMEGNDTYVFDTDSVLGSDIIDELSAEGGVDTLDFSGTSTRGISVSLSNAWSQWVNANLSLNLSAINTIENVIGGALNDTLIGNSLANRLNGNTGDDILSGGAGNDILIGDVGKNMLIGGDGADQLLTGSGEDVLLGARYWYEDDTVALGALLSEWISASSFDDRVAHLRGLLDGGTNNGFTFSQSTVREDSVRDTLSGGNGRDWYLRNSTGGSPLWYDVIEDPNLDSLFTEIALWL